MKETEPAIRLNIIDLLVLVSKWYKLFAVNFVVVVAAAVVMALLLPKWYSATAVILPPSGGMGGLPSFLTSDLKGVAMNFGLEIPSDEIYQSILGSRTLKERIVERFDLRSSYMMNDSVFIEDVLGTFGAHYFVSTQDDGTIAVTVEDRDPKRAAELTNACVEELDWIFSQISSETARKNREFIERRLIEVRDSLESLTDSIAIFQRDHHLISLPDQIQAMINVAGDMQAEILANDIKIAVMSTSLGAKHPAVAQLITSKRKLEDRYNRLLEGREGELSINILDLPELSQYYANLLRGVRICTTLLEGIYPQYESAKIQERRESANIQVIDYAKVPNRKSRPQRKLIVLISGAVSLLITLILVLFVEYWRSLPERNREDWEKLQKILGVFRRR